IKLGYAFPAPGVTINAYATPNVLSTQLTYASSPVSQTLIPSSDGYLAYNSATTNSITATNGNTLTLSIPANIIYEGQNDVISATATNAPVTLAIMYGTNTILSASSPSNSIATSNTVTLNANTLYGLIGSNTQPTAYTVNAFTTIGGTQYSVTNSLIVVPELTLSYPANNIVAGTPDDPITASVPANTFTTGIIPAGAIAIEVNGVPVAFNIAGSNTVTYNAALAGQLGLVNGAPTTYTITANVLPYSDSFAAANQVTTSNTLTVNPGALPLASLTYYGPTLAYTVPQYSYYMAPSALTSSVKYTGESGYNVPFTLTPNPSLPTPPSAATHYFTYTMPEITEPATGTPNANVIMYLTNSSTLLSSPLYWLNTTAGYNNALEYNSSQGNIVKAPAGFRTERGSEVASISTTSVTYDMAKGLDTLQFIVGPASSTISTTTKTYGPFGVGQEIQIIPNVTIANVTATCTFGTTSCSVTGLSNLTATPSVTSAITPVSINTASTPLAVLDTNANPASTLIVIGSKFVNTIAAQIFAQNPSLDSSFGPGSVIVQAFGTNRILVAGYTANETVQAGNTFIQDLLTAAGSS
ncbi:MAG: hypothetical protein QXV17_07085, partial [Candidatus Micrarchaeaceae archaeon]